MIERSQYAAVSRDDQFNDIEVYQYDETELGGIFSNNLYGRGVVFTNLITLLMLIEDCMNKIAFPQPQLQYRRMNAEDELAGKRKQSYINTTEIEIPEQAMPKAWEDAKPMATFRMRVIFRTISGWQGETECLETGNTCKFHSDLELVKFMDKEIKSLLGEK